MQLVLSRFTFVIALLLSCGKMLHACLETTPKSAPWMDSIVAEGVRKIAEANFLIHHPEFRGENNPIAQNEFGSYVITIDAAKWTPVLYPQVYSYEKTGSQPFFGPNTSTKDSLASYNLEHVSTPATYVAYFNVVINNFPFELNKDLSTVNSNENHCMFAQLQQLKVIDNQSYATSRDAFFQVVKNISVLASNLVGIDDIVVLGTANMLGQYSNKEQQRASFLAQTVVTENMDTSLAWVKQLYQIPKMYSIPFVQLVPQTTAERNAQVAIAIRNFLDCNLYGNCRPDNTMFTSLYARWLYGSLAGNQAINQQLLMSTAMRINGLPNEMAWSVLTSEFEMGNPGYVITPLGGIYNSYTNTTLATISVLATQIVRAQTALRNEPNITRDSALYYGRLLYRVPSYMLTIAPSQRIKLLKAITSYRCNDVTAVTPASDYQNHCERIAKSIYTNIPQADLKPFMDELKSSQLLWEITYRIDNATLGFFGSDNYTDFIFTISSYWKVAYPERSTPSATANVNHNVIKWESSYFDANSVISTNHSANQVIASQRARSGCPWMNVVLPSTTMDVYDPVTIHVAQGSFIPDLPGVKDLTVPAIFLDWLSHKKTIDDAATTAHVTLAVLALATGVGELYQATTITMRIVSGLEVLVSTSDLLLLNTNMRAGVIALFQDTAEGRVFIETYERIAMVINVAIVAKGLMSSLNNDFSSYVSKFDAHEPGLKNTLGENSQEFIGMKKLRGEVGGLKAATEWIDNLATILGPGSAWKIQGWIDKGLDATKTETAFANSTNKVALFNDLENAKSIYHQRVYVEDWDNIPGVVKSQHIPNGLTMAKSNSSWADPTLDLPLEEAVNFTDATAVELTAGTKIYRVTGGNKAGAYWTLQKPNSITDVIGGTAVQPKWNSFETIYVYEVPQGSSIKAWKGGTASQPVDPLVLNPHLPGGAEQVFIPQSLRDENFSILVVETTRPW